MTTDMKLSRRRFLQAAIASGSSLALTPSTMAALKGVMDREEGAPHVIWLQGQSCSGCSVSLLNSIYYMTPDTLLTDTIDLDYHSTLMVAAGDQAVQAAEETRTAGAYVLVVEGSIPTGAGGDYCHLWPGMTMHQAMLDYAVGATHILAVGACAAYGGLIAANTNPTGAQSVEQILGSDSRIVNIPGCPAHPDWVIGTIAHIIANGTLPDLDANRRPRMYFDHKIHSRCEEQRRYCGQQNFASELGEDGCLEHLGCRGKFTWADCYMRRWNSGTPGRFGVSWCVGGRGPCHGCTEPSFPGMDPFFT